MYLHAHALCYFGLAKLKRGFVSAEPGAALREGGLGQPTMHRNWPGLGSLHSRHESVVLHTIHERRIARNARTFYSARVFYNDLSVPFACRVTHSKPIPFVLNENNSSDMNKIQQYNENSEFWCYYREKLTIYVKELKGTLQKRMSLSDRLLHVSESDQTGTNISVFMMEFLKVV